MEKKLLRKIFVNFIFIAFLSLILFSVCLFSHEKNAERKNMEHLLNQVNAVYDEVQDQVLDKLSIYANERLHHLELLNFTLSTSPELLTIDGLTQLKLRMGIEDIYLLDKSGQVFLSNNTDAIGKTLLQNENADAVRSVLSNDSSANNGILIQGEPLFSDVPALDYFMTKSENEDAMLTIIGVDPAAYQQIEREVSFSKFLEEAPTEWKTSLLLLDHQTGEILGSTKDNTYIAELTHIEDEKTLNRLRRAANEPVFLELNGIHLFVKTRIINDTMLVCFTETKNIRTTIALQIGFCAIVLALIVAVMAILIRKYFQKYVFEELHIIKNTIVSLISGEEHIKFQTQNSEEMKELAKTLNTWTTDYHYKDEQITELTSKLKNATDASEHDSLTGLDNRYSFEKRMRKWLSEKPDGSVLLMMDLDNFKVLNDTLGHPEGDMALQLVADYLCSEFRDTDLISRLGGDEFAVFMRSSHKIELAHLHTKLKHLIRNFQARLPESYQSCGLSISIGAVFVNEALSFEELYKEVDEALYQAKEKGKSQYVIL